ncbi:transposase family protein [Streptomyces pseudogriseolus]|uniref:transposase family protein n=1 Tax=Streptomyces pseudogriseolus TaxID=36817 RepID=UPI003FA33296
MLAVLRCDQWPGDLAGGNGIHRTTVTRWAWEAVGLLAAHAPRPGAGLKKIARTGGGVVLLDGSAIRTRRRIGKENRRNCSGKNKCHGLLVIALTDDRGRLLWISAARLGRTWEISACRHDKLTQKTEGSRARSHRRPRIRRPRRCRSGSRPCGDHRLQGRPQPALTRSQRVSNKALAAAQAPVEHGFAHLKSWRFFAKVRTGPRWATALVGALLVLTNRKVAR